MFASTAAIYFLSEFCILSTVPALSQASRESTWPFDLTSPFSYPTPDPININTSTVRVCKSPTPFVVTVGLLDTHVLTNTGFGVEVTNTGPLPILTSVTGGPLGTGYYLFEKIQYFWASSYAGPVSGSIDGINAAIQVRAVLRNKKYDTFLESLYQRDGLAIVVFNVQAEGKLDAPAFRQFGRELQKIRKAGTSIVTGALPLFLWFNELPAEQYYYSYPGSYFDPVDKKKQYNCATIIEFTKAGQPGVSIRQYEMFTQLKDFSGKPLINSLEPAPAGLRPIVEFSGDMEIILPA